MRFAGDYIVLWSRTWRLYSPPSAHLPSEYSDRADLLRADIHLSVVLLTISALASIIQQIHLVVEFNAVLISLFLQRFKIAEFPALVFSSTAHPVGVAMNFIEFYCYNAVSMLFLFWYVSSLFISLFCFQGSWTVKVSCSS